MIDSIFKRVIAYLIDMMLVSVVVGSIVSSKVVNFQLENYQKFYKEYYELHTLYQEQTNNDIKTCDDLDKVIEEKKLTEEKYVSEYKTLKDSYSKQEIVEDEYKNRCLSIIENYNSNKINKEQYTDKVDYYFYHLEKNSIVSYVLNIFVYILYFVFFQGFTGGQTLGKKIMRLKVVSTKEKDNLSYKQLFFRTLLLPISTSFQTVSYCILMFISVLFIPKSLFGAIADGLYFVNYILSLVLIFTLFFNKGKAGIHDILVHTKVIEVDFKGNEKKSNKEKSIDKAEDVDVIKAKKKIIKKDDKSIK